MSRKASLISPLLAVTIIAVVNTLATYAQQSTSTTPISRGASTTPRTERLIDEAATPIVDLDTSLEPSRDNVRALKSKRYDHQHRIFNSLPAGAGNVMLPPPSADIADIPASASDLIVEGVVTGSAAFLSNDRQSVYSEFTVRVTDVLMSRQGGAVRLGDVLTTERLGGRVRYPDGRIVRYELPGYGSPIIGVKYLLFLSDADAGNYRVLTGYEVHGHTVRPLDGARISYRGAWSCDRHNGQAYEELRTEVAHAIAADKGRGPSR